MKNKTIMNNIFTEIWGLIFFPGILFGKTKA